MIADIGSVTAWRDTMIGTARSVIGDCFMRIEDDEGRRRRKSEEEKAKKDGKRWKQREEDGRREKDENERKKLISRVNFKSYE